MKNIFYKFLFITFAILICTVNVFADDRDNLDRYVSQGTATLLCEYTDSDKNIQNRIYYFYKKKDDVQTTGPWAYVYNLNGHLYYLEGLLGDNLSLGQFYHVFGSTSRVFYNGDVNGMPKELEDNFTCPNYVFTDLGGIGDLRQVCYRHDSPIACNKQYEYGPFHLNTEADTIFKYIDDTALTYATESTELLEEWIYKKDYTQKVKDKVRRVLQVQYNLGSTYELPKFIDKYIESISYDEPTAKEEEALAAAKKRVDAVIVKRVEQGILTEEEGNALREDLKNRELSDMFTSPVTNETDLNFRDSGDCNGLLGPDMSIIVKNLFKFVQYLGPVLIAVFSSMDFIKAAIAGDDGQMKKASERLGKRIVCGILLFFVPLICSILLDFGGITLTDICIEQYGSSETSP